MAGYDYAKLRAFVFTEKGQESLLRVRQEARKLLNLAGACQAGRLLRVLTGDTWESMACVDRLVELGVLREVHSDIWQNRVFVAGREDL